MPQSATTAARNCATWRKWDIANLPRHPSAEYSRANPVRPRTTDRTVTQIQVPQSTRIMKSYSVFGLSATFDWAICSDFEPGNAHRGTMVR